MAARKSPIETVKVGDIAVKIDTAYMQSWDGVMAAAEMQKMANDESVSEGEKLYAILTYYENAIANLDDVKDACGGGKAPIAEVFNVLGQAIQASTAKNR